MFARKPLRQTGGNAIAILSLIAIGFGAGSFTPIALVPQNVSSRVDPLDQVVATRPQLVNPIAPADALAANAALPFLANGLEPAFPFVLNSRTANPLERRAALDCLTAAIYYEAAGESEQGQRAVAQVILNRVHHPAYPARICDVVYQGSDRSSGCQFTFTCDGSLNRPPRHGGWLLARQIAGQALDGAIEPAVGMATHYHTKWVAPYWAPQLDKIAAVGAHIFYRWGGGWGRRKMFKQPYAGEILSAPYQLPNSGGLVVESIPDATTLMSSYQAANESPVGKAAGPVIIRESGPLADERPPRLAIDEREFTLVEERPRSLIP